MIKIMLEQFIADFDKRIIAKQNGNESDKQVARGYSVVVDELEQLLVDHYGFNSVGSLSK